MSSKKKISDYIRIVQSVVYVLVVATTLISLLMVSLFLFALVRKYLSKKVSKELIPSPSSYQYFELNPSTNEASVGFITLYQEIPEDGYFNYENSDGNIVMVSNFYTTQYRGLGSCKCSSGGTENILNDVPFLIATNNDPSQRSIQELQIVCEKKFGERCEKSSVEPEVWQYEKTPEVEEEMRHFMCEEDVRKEIVDAFDCSKLWKSGEVYVPTALDWCMDNSRITPINFTHVDLDGDIWSQNHACYSERFTNPTVKCIELFDEE